MALRSLQPARKSTRSLGGLEEAVELREWYNVQFSEEGIHLDVAPPEKEVWQALLPGADITRVCYKVESGLISDGVTSSPSNGPRSTP